MASPFFLDSRFFLGFRNVTYTGKQSSFFLRPSTSLSLASSSSYFLSLFFLFFSFLFSFFFSFSSLSVGLHFARFLADSRRSLQRSLASDLAGVPSWVTVFDETPVWQLGARYFFPLRCLPRFFFFSFHIFFFYFFSLFF